MLKYNPIASRRQFCAAAMVAAAAPWDAFAKAADGFNFAGIRAIADRYVSERLAPSVVVAIGRRGLPPEFVSAGQQELGAGPLAGPDTLYRIYSMTKLVTGIAVMQLVEDGKLKLDTPVAAIFPQYAEQSVLVDPANGLVTRPAERPMLVRHLLTHSAGVGYLSNVPEPVKPLYEGVGSTARMSPEEEAKKPPNLIAFAEKVGGLPLLFEPGTGWNYSIGLDVAGAVVEKLSGLPFEVFLQQRIFDPLGMVDTFFTVPEDKLDRFVAMYERGQDGLKLLEPSAASSWANPPRFPGGGGGLVSSARDYSRFMAMLLNEGELAGTWAMKTETARLAMSDMMEPGVMRRIGSAHSGFGAGGRVVVDPIEGGERPGTYGWSGAAATHAFVDRESGFYAVLMTQVRGWFPSPLTADITQALYQGGAAG